MTLARADQVPEPKALLAEARRGGSLRSRVGGERPRSAPHRSAGDLPVGRVRAYQFNTDDVVECRKLDK
jgi:hypothetical protein